MNLPLVLISQIQRSGGTLLSQLFDGHPECPVYPHELKIGRPTKIDWPDLPLDGTPERLFGLLCHRALDEMACFGYEKAGRNPFAQQQVLPFTFDVDRFAERFLDSCRCRPPVTQRDVLDAYFQAFFATWADWRRTGRERVVVAFMPRVQMVPASLERYRRDYPDGRMITVIRDPWSWFASAARHSHAYSRLDRAMDLWRASAEASLQLVTSAPERTLGVLYEDLVRDTRCVMATLAQFLGISWDDCLLRPTYCGHPMIANSSFPICDAGLSQEPVTRPLDLAPETRAYIDDTAAPLYLSCVERIRGAEVPGINTPWPTSTSSRNCTAPPSAITSSA